MSLFRYDPPLASYAREGFVRPAVDGPIVCGTCGCRMEAAASGVDGAGLGGAWRHFEGLPGRDARGCRVACVDLTHGRDGRVLG